MRFQLVLQWPLSSLRGLDELLSLEELLMAKITDQNEVHGHDFGSGEANMLDDVRYPDKPGVVHDEDRLGHRQGRGMNAGTRREYSSN